MPNVPIDGHRISYERTGPEGAAAVVLIHGLGSGGRDWAPQIEALSTSYRVIAPDLRGHGRSPRYPDSGELSIAGHARDVAALLRHEGITQAHIVGLSLGGAVAFQLAVDAPGLVRSLTIVNSAPSFVPRAWRERLAVAQRKVIIRMLGMDRMAKVLAGRLFPNDKDLQRQFVEGFADNDTKSYLAALRGLVGWTVDDRLGEIACPVLVVAADQDYAPVERKRAYVERLPDARLAVIDDAHHAVTVERPDAFNEVLLTFLFEHAAPRDAA